jgi:hypothetical protein
MLNHGSAAGGHFSEHRGAAPMLRYNKKSGSITATRANRKATTAATNTTMMAVVSITAVSPRP